MKLGRKIPRRRSGGSLMRFGWANGKKRGFLRWFAEGMKAPRKTAETRLVSVGVVRFLSSGVERARVVTRRPLWLFGFCWGAVYRDGGKQWTTHLPLTEGRRGGSGLSYFFKMKEEPSKKWRTPPPGDGIVISMTIFSTKVSIEVWIYTARFSAKRGKDTV